MKKKMNNPIYLGFSILEISKTLIFEFWYEYMKPKYVDSVKLCYMDTDNFINYEVVRLLPIVKNKKVVALMKDELEGKVMTEFVSFRPKTYSYLIDDDNEAKKAKGTKTCVIKKYLNSMIIKIPY